MSTSYPVLRVRAGRHDRVHAPVRVPWNEAEAPPMLEGPAGAVPCQLDGDSLVFIPAPLSAGADAAYRPGRGTPEPAVRVTEGEGTVTFAVAGGLLTTYHHAHLAARPYFWPLNAPGGVPVTRAWPMSDADPNETRDHRHHRSMYVAYGDVNGVDNWSEETGHGHTVPRVVVVTEGGPVFGRMDVESDWTDASGQPVLREQLGVTLWMEGPGFRMLDVTVALEAAYGDVTFGDTKEGGILTVRVASALDVQRGGRIENAYGGIDEGETWGKAAHWCDYSGVVDGSRVGIAVMNGPGSFRWPTYWHVRDYGLMAANPFALAAYTDGRTDGSHTLAAGQALQFTYRVLLHEGDASDADVRGRYLDWVAPPTVEVCSQP